MADTYKKADSSVVFSSDPEVVVEDAWKDAQVEKEHQPEKIKSNLTYRSLEDQVEDIDLSITSLTKQKEALEAEMVKVKSAAEA